MVPIHLKLKNFLSYREETELDFSTIRIACLSGDNGSGKSALLDAITWAIWGKTRASNDRDVISIGASELEVTYIFRMRASHDRLELRPDLVTHLRVTSARLTEVSERYDLAQQLAGTLALQVAAYEQIEQMLAAVKTRANRESEALRTLERELQQLRA